MTFILLRWYSVQKKLRVLEKLRHVSSNEAPRSRFRSFQNQAGAVRPGFQLRGRSLNPKPANHASVPEGSRWGRAPQSLSQSLC
jgi:hypothetical protein